MALMLMRELYGIIRFEKQILYYIRNALIYCRILPHGTDQYHDSFMCDSDYHGFKKKHSHIEFEIEDSLHRVVSVVCEHLTTRQSTNLRTEQHHKFHHRRARLHTHQTCSTETYSTVRGLSSFLSDTHTSMQDTKMLSKKHCQRVLLLLTVIVVKFIKSMPQRRQEQTAERKREQGERRGGERSTMRQWITKKQDTRKQVGRRRSATHLLAFIITVALRLTLRLIWFNLGLASCLKRVQNPDFIPAWRMSEAAKRHTLTSSHTAAQALILSPPVVLTLKRCEGQWMGRLHRDAS